MQPRGRVDHQSSTNGHIPPPAAPPTVISARGVTKVFQVGKRVEPLTALGGVDLDVGKGSVVCLVGPSGCGKSTLLNMMAGLERPTSGEVSYDGRPVAGVNTRAGYITQKDNLLPWATVERNIGVALELRKVKRKERKERVEEAMCLVGLEGFGHYYPGQLSGGMRKRVTLARTFIYEPETLLMDEPFGALDAQLKVHLQTALLQLRDRGGQTVVFVTHDLDEAVAIGDRVLVFAARPGRIVHQEDISLPHPRDVLALRSDPRFLEIVARLWKKLAPSVEEEQDLVGAIEEGRNPE